MAPEQSTEMVEALEASRKYFNDAVAGVSESQAGAIPGGEQWSVLQCAEHLTLVEERALTGLQRVGRLDSPLVDSKEDVEKMALAADRTRRAVAPEPVRPSGRFASLADAVEQFNAARTRTIAFANERAADLPALDCKHPLLGPMNGRALLFFVAGHTRRHADQIRETRTRTEMVEELEASRKVFNNAAGGLSESQAGTSPAAGRWSVLQCVEHVATVEERFQGFLERAGRRDLPSIDPQKEAGLMARVTDRTARAEAPEPVRPSGRFSSLQEAVEGFNAARTRTIAFALERAADLPALDCHHQRFGALNGRELCMIMAGHARRHAEQIREIRAAL
jgi:hypothetical protein